jgi:hypothetical protein
MTALYDQSGAAYAWLHKSGKIYDLAGQNLAFIEGDSIYSWSGDHIGWWQDGHGRDSHGAVAFFTANATNLDVLTPFRQFAPFKPFTTFAPFKPFLAAKPFRSSQMSAWSNKLPF